MSSRINLPLLALAIGAFAIGTTEFSPMGLLPNIAHDLGASIPRAGMLITGYALGVMLGAPIMTLWFGGFARRNALILLMAIFTIGNLIAAFAPNYMSLMGARLITSLNHGAFFGIGSVVAASVVPANKQASAVATMFMGLTIANIGGVPLATWVGQNIGWRMSFLAISALGIITMLALWKALPIGAVGQKPNVKMELKVLTRLPVVLALLTTVFGASAMFTLYTYIAPSLVEFNHASPTFITLMLVLIGIGFSIGNHLGGKFADISVNKTLIGFLGLLIGLMLIFPMLAQTQLGAAIGLVIWGAAAFAIVPPLQMRVMSVAHEASGLASSVNIGAFNLGNAIGAAAGGAVLSLGLNYSAVSMIGAVLAAIGLILVFIQIKLSTKANSALQQCPQS
ncbi:MULTISPECIES: MFS transporter [unclassified Acinetobacter]|uniref:MFS transporter n=1 Tax=unclassified Acinetobacter TaxID=196816 RepID=UPI0024474B98|nr:MULTISPECIES: MFS transporter [unclassified Acinetobacter]MDH0032702.1 MFS transporter [Acinetobacter sp. GD04021]MDH0888137.1 MFS transporter [Acinetobacter sp. GD03873]MDH1084488.1 MFS transporter [Acinetobacter sp. GD03983]MDH2191454.1 MFS transporter [Acinetobacter sp. GD03645]MDH2205027.1 MFS transporter [Acinetobacter sp. GD03647]